MTSVWSVNFVSVDDRGLISASNKLFRNKTAAIDYIAEQVYRDLRCNPEGVKEVSEVVEGRQEADEWLKRVREHQLGHKKQELIYFYSRCCGSTDTVYLQRIKPE